ILASIRRIIEDSDPGRKLPEDNAGSAEDLDPVAGERPEAEIATFRAELRAEPEVRKPFTLADVQARMTAEEHAFELAAPEVSAPSRASTAFVEAERGGEPLVEAPTVSGI